MLSLVISSSLLLSWRTLTPTLQSRSLWSLLSSLMCRLVAKANRSQSLLIKELISLTQLTAPKNLHAEGVMPAVWPPILPQTVVVLPSCQKAVTVWGSCRPSSLLWKASTLLCYTVPCMLLKSHSTTLSKLRPHFSRSTNTNLVVGQVSAQQSSHATKTVELVDF